MTQLTLSDLLLALRDLVGPQRALLSGCVTGQLYLPALQTKLAMIESLPPTLIKDRPLADELDAEDALHDGAGAAIYFLTEAYLRHLGLDAELRAAAQRVRDAVIPDLGELQRSYTDEASAAQRRAELLPSLRQDLERFPVAAGKTLYDWVKGFVQHGQRIDQLLTERNRAAGEASRKSAASLRSSTLALLGRMRGALADELPASPKLPRGLDALIFGRYDELLRARAVLDATPPPSPPAPATAS